MNSSNLKIVLIGGGTGNAVLLRVLKKYTENITAIVTVADDGGSSGNLRDEMGIIAPGDIRNCLVALAEEESIMASLMDLRFTEGFIKKQSLGNIILAGMNKICGNFPLSVKYISEVLAIKGQVLPVTTENIILSAKLSNGKVINGESKIAKYCAKTGLKIERINIIPREAKAFGECLTAIEAADIIVYSPGSLYTSLIPNFLVKGICEALARTKAKRYYLANIMTEDGETTHYNLSDHIRAIEKHTPGCDIIDTVVYNVADVPNAALRRYKKENAVPVKAQIDEDLLEKYDFLGMDLVNADGGIVRHDSAFFWKYILK